MLARPGTVSLALLFGGLAAAVSANALWMQSEHHPAPLFRQPVSQPRHPLARKIPETQPAPGPANAEQLGAAMLPPSRPAELGRSAEREPTPAASPGPGKRPAKDPIADLLGGAAPVPPARIKGPAVKRQTVEKRARPAAPAPANDAIAALIERTARSR